MKLYIALLFTAFLCVATPAGQLVLRRPLLWIGACAVTGAMFYSTRVVL